MPIGDDSRYHRVSRRAMLKASLGASVAAATGVACGNQDSEVFAGSVAEPVSTTSASSTTTAPTTSSSASPEQADDSAESTTTEPAPTTTAPEAALVAVAGEMVISFTYTQGAGGKNESPYVAVWIEDAEGDLLTTVALYYQQGRKGARWLDHLDRWFGADAARIAAGGQDVAAAISSATRSAGDYAVAWDGTVETGIAPAGDYFVCVEAVREEGPLSLIREPISLSGSLPPMTLPDDGELSMASVQINV